MAIKVIDLDGKVHELQLRENLTLFDLMDDAGLQVRADCGGNCCCSTCHVKIEHPDASRQASLTKRSFDEDSMLEEAITPVTSISKLCCMMEVTPELDGLVVTLTEDTRIPE